MSGNEAVTYDEFKDRFNRPNFTKAYIPIIIGSLAESHPRSLSKGTLASNIRKYYRNYDSYERYNIWDTMTDYYKLTKENNGFYELNIQNLGEVQKKDLIELCTQKIRKLEGIDNQSISMSSQNQHTVNPTMKNDNEMNNKSSIEEIPSLESNEVENIEDIDNETNYETEKYFLIKIDVNLKEKVSFERLNDYGFDIARRDRRSWNSYENKIHKAILYDIKGNYPRIWGNANLTFGGYLSKNEPYVKITNFRPVNAIVDGQVKPNWLRVDLAKDSMFTNRRIYKIHKLDYQNILDSCVPPNELFDRESEESLPEETESIQYTKDLPLEIPSRDIMEKGIKEIGDSLLIDKKTLEEIVMNLASGRNILLAGPIGTGKTHLAGLIPRKFWSLSNTDLGYNTEVYTASYEWSVNDVIGGIVPRMDGENPTYVIQYGCVVETVKESWENKKHHNNSETSFRGTWLGIDEFNRAEIDKAFGQLFTSLETRILRIPDERSPKLKKMKIPMDYRIIGTLNTSDKHYLFKLSDALKRRFAYIEVKSPPKSESEREIFYALNNAMKELSTEKFSSMINLIQSTKKLSEIQPNVEFTSAIRSAYEILSFIRMIKDMGTAILKSIYQTMLVGTKIEGYNDNILDIALNGNLIPQLERVQATSIEIILQFCFKDVHSFFRQMYDAPDDDARQKYVIDFENYLKFLGIQETDKLKDKYWRKSIDTDAWNLIFEKWNAQKPRNGLPRNLPLFRASLEDLKKTFEFL